MKIARKFVATLSTGLVSFTATSFGAATAGAVDSVDVAHYEVVFTPAWTSKTHPKDFPLLAHLSPIIGETHAPGMGFIPVGGTATDGLEILCETGKHQPLDAEIKAAINSGSAGTLIETMEPIDVESGRAVATFEIDAKHPQVSIAAMLAPSPDWCAAALAVDLRDGTSWVNEKQVQLFSYDVGTDKATSYRAFDKEMKPRGAIAQNPSSYFVKDGQPTPVGTAKFVRK